MGKVRENKRYNRKGKGRAKTSFSETKLKLQGNFKGDKTDLYYTVEG